MGLTAPAVTLRSVRPLDLPLFYDMQRDPVSSGLAAVAPRDREAFEAHWASVLANGSVTVRTVLSDDDVAGNVLCFGEPGDRRVGYWLSRPFWGRGLASRALVLLLEEVTERPLFATVAVHNVASLRVLEKAGFVPVGTDRQADGVQLVRLVLDAETERRR